MRDRRPRGPLRAPLLLTRYLGAAALLGVGADHLDQYALAHYRAIPTIGTLFAVDFAAATLVAAALAAPVERLSPRLGRATLDALALGGIGIAAGSLAGLLVSERASLFGFTETGYRGAIVLSIILELATIVLLAGFLALPEPAPSTIVDRRWPAIPTHPRSTKPRKRSWRPSGPAARPRSGK
jgi:MFS family permease